MGASLIRMEVDNLAANANHDFSYNNLITLNEGNPFWATQVALSRCYKYEFDAKLAQKAKLVGNVNFYQFRARLEQELQQFIKEKFLTQTKRWDITKPAHEYINFLEELNRIDLNEIKYTLLSLKTIKDAEVFTLESMIVAVLSVTSESYVIDEKKMIGTIEAVLSNALPKIYAS